MTMTVAFLLCASRGFCGTPAKAATQDVSFKAQGDGTEQKYVLLFPAAFTSSAPHDVLIALHGHGADRWQFVREKRDECRAARDFAVAHGMLFVSPDYRASTSWMGPAAEADVVQLIADLKRTYRVSRVFLCGGSMGGTACLTFAVLHPKLIDGVASMNGLANFLEYENFQDAIQASFGGTKTQIPLEYRKRSAEFWPEKLTMPIALTAGGKDDAVPPQSVLRLSAELKKRGRKVLMIYRENGGHSTNHADTTEALEFAIREAAEAPTTKPTK